MESRYNFFKRNRIYGLVSGFLSTVLYTFFVIDQSVREFFEIQSYELFIFYPRMGIGVIGYFIGWFHAKMGGVLMIASGLLMASYMTNSNKHGSGIYIVLFLLSYFLPGVFIIISDFKNKSRKS